MSGRREKRITIVAGSGEQLSNLTNTKVDQREGASAGSRHLGVQIQAQTLEDRGNDFAGIGGTIRGHRSDRVAGTDRATALDTAASKRARKTLRPMITTTGRIDFRCASELGQTAHHRVI